MKKYIRNVVGEIMKNPILAFVVFLLISQLVMILFYKSSVYTQAYDADYWKDRYEHSQYSLPLSNRIIGDDGLHAYAGYRLIKGDDPFSINNDKPPAGKYVIGLSILLFNNPVVFALIGGLLSLLLIYLIINKITHSPKISGLITGLIFVDPLFFSQMWIAGLDLLQLLFILAAFYFLSNSKGKKTAIYALIAGFCLGFFAEIKPPLLAPLIYGLVGIYLLMNFKVKRIVFLSLGVFVGVLLPYVRYLMLDHSLIDIVRVHKFVSSIYLVSSLEAQKISIWSSLLIGKYQNLSTGKFINVTEWNILWPIVLVLSISFLVSIVIKRKAKRPLMVGLLIYAVVCLLVYTFIPFYVRYAVLFLPAMYVVAFIFLKDVIGKKIVQYLLVALIVVGFFNSYRFLQDDPNILINNFYHSYTNQYFVDIYEENLVNKNSIATSSAEFEQISRRAMLDATISSIEIVPGEVSLSGNKGTFDFIAIYKTSRLGSFREEKSVGIVKRNNIWKILWEWDLLFSEFSPGSRISVEYEEGRRGTIFKNELPFAYDAKGVLITVNPDEIDTKEETKMLEYIGGLVQQSAVGLQNSYLENTLPGEYVPLATNFFELKESEKNKLMSFDGVRLLDYPVRLYSQELRIPIENVEYKECCTGIYSRNNYHGFLEEELEFDNILWGTDGGEIIMEDKNGILKIIHQIDVINGEDVYL